MKTEIKIILHQRRSFLQFKQWAIPQVSNYIWGQIVQSFRSLILLSSLALAAVDQSFFFTRA